MCVCLRLRVCLHLFECVFEYVYDSLDLWMRMHCDMNSFITVPVHSFITVPVYSCVTVHMHSCVTVPVGAYAFVYHSACRSVELSVSWPVLMGVCV